MLKVTRMSSDKAYRLIGLFFLALLAFNFPVLKIFGKGESLFGIPVFYLYIFVVWFGLIFLVFYFLDYKKSKKDES